jgi:hypothetical protein
MGSNNARFITCPNCNNLGGKVTGEKNNYFECDQCHRGFPISNPNIQEQLQRSEKQRESEAYKRLHILIRESLGKSTNPDYDIKIADANTLIKTADDFRMLFPLDPLAIFYHGFAKRENNPAKNYGDLLDSIPKNIAYNKLKEILDVTTRKARIVEEDYIKNLINMVAKGDDKKKFYNQLDKAISIREKEHEIYNLNIKRDLFICHSSTDSEIVNSIIKELERDGRTCWVSSRNLRQDTENYKEDIQKAIRNSKIFLIVGSKRAMHSPDVQDEMYYAEELEKPRIAYKIDNYDATTDFKDFLGKTGTQWIDASKKPEFHELKRQVSKLKKKMHRKETFDINEDKKPKKLSDFPQKETEGLHNNVLNQNKPGEKSTTPKKQKVTQGKSSTLEPIKKTVGNLKQPSITKPTSKLKPGEKNSKKKNEKAAHNELPINTKKTTPIDKQELIVLQRDLIKRGHKIDQTNKRIKSASLQESKDQINRIEKQLEDITKFKKLSNNNNAYKSKIRKLNTQHKEWTNQHSLNQAADKKIKQAKIKVPPPDIDSPKRPVDDYPSSIQIKKEKKKEEIIDKLYILIFFFLLHSINYGVLIAWLNIPILAIILSGIIILGSLIYISSSIFEKEFNFGTTLLTVFTIITIVFTINGYQFSNTNVITDEPTEPSYVEPSNLGTLSDGWNTALYTSIVVLILITIGLIVWSFNEVEDEIYTFAPIGILIASAAVHFIIFVGFDLALLSVLLSITIAIIGIALAIYGYSEDEPIGASGILAITAALIVYIVHFILTNSVVFISWDTPLFIIAIIGALGTIIFILRSFADGEEHAIILPIYILLMLLNHFILHSWLDLSYTSLIVSVSLTTIMFIIVSFIYIDEYFNNFVIATSIVLLAAIIYVTMFMITVETTFWSWQTLGIFTLIILAFFYLWYSWSLVEDGRSGILVLMNIGITLLNIFVINETFDLASIYWIVGLAQSAALFISSIAYIYDSKDEAGFVFMVLSFFNIIFLMLFPLL